MYSQLLLVTQCPLCNYTTYNHDPMTVIQLSITNQTHSLKDCFTEYCSIETPDSNNQWKCDSCHQMTQPKKKTNFWKLSDVIVILLKRYTRNGTKINKHIDFPEILDMYPYSPNYHNQELYYKLSGICIQSGSMNGGHYYAICKNDLDNKWHIYDDNVVSPIDFKEACKKNPYCLFYKRNG